ncbi:MAG: hypothetical protein JNK23_04630 [Opitutaceae bacterium]|nr:hypothetical protein [Opitutaceae bacterium]
MQTHLTLLLDDRVLQRYARAARRLRRTLGSGAPTTEQLIAHELSDREGDLIVADYFETRERRRRK